MIIVIPFKQAEKPQIECITSMFPLSDIVLAQKVFVTYLAKVPSQQCAMGVFRFQKREQQIHQLQTSNDHTV